MLLGIKLFAVLAIAAPCALAHGMKTAVKFPNQAMYESFLAGIDLQVEKDKERQKEYIFVPQVRDPRYDVDRHGQEFVRCREYNETDLDGGKNVRCTRRSAMFDPICTLTINYDKRTVRGGCMESPIENREQCQTTCSVKKGVYQFQFDPTQTVAIGNCCCTSYMCNSDYKEIIRKELAGRRIRRDSKGHHHHHHKEQEEEGTPEVDSVQAFFDSLL